MSEAETIVLSNKVDKKTHSLSIDMELLSLGEAILRRLAWALDAYSGESRRRLGCGYYYFSKTCILYARPVDKN